MLLSVSVGTYLDPNFQALSPVTVPLLCETKIGIVLLFAHQENTVILVYSWNLVVSSCTQISFIPTNFLEQSRGILYLLQLGEDQLHRCSTSFRVESRTAHAYSNTAKKLIIIRFCLDRFRPSGM